MPCVERDLGERYRDSLGRALLGSPRGVIFPGGPPESNRPHLLILRKGSPSGGPFLFVIAGWVACRNLVPQGAASASSSGDAMRLFLLTTLTMVAFAANSVLNRVALADGDMEATLFGVIRLVSGALMLGLLLFLRGKGIALKLRQTVFPVLALLAYIFGFSAAYGALDPGFGALVLFSIVQATMFAGALLAQEHVPAGRWAGAVLALAGLAWHLWRARRCDNAGGGSGHGVWRAHLGFGLCLVVSIAPGPGGCTCRCGSTECPGHCARRWGALCRGGVDDAVSLGFCFGDGRSLGVVAPRLTCCRRRDLLVSRHDYSWIWSQGRNQGARRGQTRLWTR